jgi:Cu(I)/Ag(I) efflux system membrane protein CusA/SilA
LEGTEGGKICGTYYWGKYIDIVAKREVIGRYGLSVDDVNSVVEAAIWL